jgi:antitoxin VapB
MKKAKIFKNGQSQAVRLPKEYRFDEDEEVIVQKYGEGILILPINKAMTSLRKSLDLFSEDYLTERSQPPIQAREEF